MMMIAAQIFSACSDHSTWKEIHEFPTGKSVVIIEDNGDIDIEPRWWLNPHRHNKGDLDLHGPNVYRLDLETDWSYSLYYADQEWAMDDTKHGRPFHWDFSKNGDTIHIWWNTLYPANLTDQQIIQDDIYYGTQKDSTSKD